jgi:RNA polymerase sigma-70 factor (ECF subfamily)
METFCFHHNKLQIIMSFQRRGESQLAREQLQSMSDEELATHIAGAASEEAYTELFNRYRRRVYLWCFNYTHEQEEAVDLAQEVFIKLFRGIDRFAGRSRLSTWVYQVARNHCLGELGKSGRKWRKRLVSIEGEDMLQIADEDVYEAFDAGGDVDRIIESAKGILTNDELDAFVLHYREGLTVREITALLRCDNVTGARTLIQNARRKFRRVIDEKGFRDER